MGNVIKLLHRKAAAFLFVALHRRWGGNEVTGLAGL